jgi:acyl-CoA oxidase
MTTTTSSPLRSFLHGERLAHLSDLDGLLDEPEFGPTSPASNRERNLRTYARLAAVARHEGGSVSLAADTARLNAVQEWMAVVDPCVSHAGLVHFAVCTWAIGALGRPGAYLAELTADLDRGQAAGSILVTEVGRSNSHIAVATEARFDAPSRTFTLRTPDDGAAKIMANVAEPGVPKIAIVFAQLVVGERRCGLFPFAMRIQGEDGPAQGVRVAALSDVPAVPLDYALVRFEDARVPFDSWLRDSATLDADGAFDDPLGGAAPRLTRSFAFAASPAPLGTARHVGQPGAGPRGHRLPHAAVGALHRARGRLRDDVPRGAGEDVVPAGRGGAAARRRADLRAVELGEPQSRADEGGGRGRAGQDHRGVSHRRRRAGRPRGEPDHAVRGAVAVLPGGGRRQPALAPRCR